LDTGFDTVKIVVIVLVVLAQGMSSFVKWLKKKREAARQKDAALGLPTGRGEESVQTEEEPGIDWDTWGQEEEPQAPVPDTRTQPNGSIPDAVAPPTTPAPVAQVDPSPSNPAPSASMHRVIAAHAARPGAGRSTALGSRPSLRSLMLSKIVLDPPVSARRGSARSPRG